jgi:hypothetical protein
MSTCREENATMDDRQVVQHRGWKEEVTESMVGRADRMERIIIS